MKFGEKVRAARIAAGYSQKQLADLTGISLRTVQNYESGERMPKQRESYVLLGKALNVSPQTLMDDDAEFILKTRESFGDKAARDAQRLVNEVTVLYSGGELAEEDMDAMMRAIQDAYWIAKERNRKYIPRKFRGSASEDEN